MSALADMQVQTLRGTPSKQPTTTTGATAMTAPISTWAVTEIAHPGTRDVSEDCKECLAYADTAIAHARATGSTGCTYGQGNGAGHSITVQRALAVIVVDPAKARTEGKQA